MDAYLVWSNEHGGWWRAGRSGYTKNLAEAGRYTRVDAMRICRDAVMTAAHIGMISELPVRLFDVETFLELYGQPLPEAISHG